MTNAPEITSRAIWLKADVVQAVVRLLCLAASVTALSIMTTAKQRSTLSLYGFSLPLYSNWSFSDSFRYLVGVCAAVAVHSLVQLAMYVWRMGRNCPLPSRKHVWLRYAGDQIFAYGMISAGSAASGVTNLNRTGIHHADLPDFCSPLRMFCTRVGVSIALVFLSCLLLSVSVVVDVLSLSHC